jgi:hypothetical protein
LSGKTASEIRDGRTYVEKGLESYCGAAFVPRYRRERISGTGGTKVELRKFPIRSVRSVKRDGTAITDLAEVVVDGSHAYYSTTWTTGVRNYEVIYEYGFDDSADEYAEAKEAALVWVKNHLVKGPIDDRATGFTTEDASFAMSTPGVRGAHTGIPAVDEFINSHQYHAAIA